MLENRTKDRKKRKVKGKRNASGLITEAEFIQQVNIIAEKHNCRTVFIDPDKRLINIEGPEAKQTVCAKAIEVFMRDCRRVEEVKEDEVIKQVKENVGWLI